MTIHKVDFTQPLWRYLYQPLYQRVLDYGLANKETEQNIIARFVMLHTQDTNIYLLVELDNTTILSHCLILLAATIGKRTALIEQLETKSLVFVEECFNYITNEISDIQRLLVFTNEKDFRKLKKKYTLKVSNIILEKELGTDSI